MCSSHMDRLVWINVGLIGDNYGKKDMCGISGNRVSHR